MTNFTLNKQLIFENLDEQGNYRIIFRDKHQIIKPGIIDILKETVSYLGPYFISALGIKIGKANLLTHERKNQDKKVQYPITIG